ncbi:hypothetical protein PIB30_063947 [Stylosanthes scabra]|uniref:F-box domain-containing protein n=1 Tax=Stylosanthes scabra TaxID=79078 RepID=A0ABU6SLP1_9FABA|nr:hypothetical protein [Stylosanthes scabra]
MKKKNTKNKPKINNQNCSSSSIGFNDLPIEVIREILLRLSVKNLGQLSCVSKLWQTIISDHSFAKLHLQHSPFSTQRCIVIQNIDVYDAQVVDLDSLFHRNSSSSAMENVSLPLNSVKWKLHPRVHVVGSYNGFVCLHREPYSLNVWNPLTGSYKGFSYYRHIVRNAYPVEKTWNSLKPLRITLLSGFGYDESKDDYFVIAAWKDKKEENHFDFYSLRTNSWKSFEVELPNKPRRRDPGLFFNGAFHWLPEDVNDDTILVFDITKKSFSVIPMPERKITSYYANLVVLRGCLALYTTIGSTNNNKIWIMKEYKVKKSWTVVYNIPRGFLRPLCLSSGGDLVGLSHGGLTKVNVGSGERSYATNVQVSNDNYCQDHKSIMYTESLMPLPSDSEEKKKRRKKRKGQQEENQSEVKQGKRRRRTATGTC